MTVGVPRLPRISNAADFEPLAAEPGVRVAYLPLDATLDDTDAVVLPGTKNTVDDLRALRNAGFERELRAFAGPVVGLCGGYQLLGERITNADVEGSGDREAVTGFGLLPVETQFSPEKRVERVERDLRGVGPFAGASGRVAGDESDESVRRGCGPARSEPRRGCPAFGPLLNALATAGRERPRRGFLVVPDEGPGDRDGRSTGPQRRRRRSRRPP